jgi:hypothetical protein
MYGLHPLCPAAREVELKESVGQDGPKYAQARWGQVLSLPQTFSGYCLAFFTTNRL